MPFILKMTNGKYEIGGVGASLPAASSVNYWKEKGFGYNYSLEYFLEQGTTGDPNLARVYLTESSYKKTNAYSLGGRPVEVEIKIK
jgi:hypothetical protein